jgi:transcriptional enhancer factor
MLADEPMRRWLGGGSLPRDQRNHQKYGRPRVLPSQGLSTSSATLGAHSVAIYPTDFAMWLLVPERQAIQDSLHTYTRLSPVAHSETRLDDVHHWRSRFPHVGLLNNDGAVDCQITLYEATLDTEVHSNEATSLVLANSLELALGPRFNYHMWKCSTNIFLHGRQVKQHITKLTVKPGGVAAAGIIETSLVSDFWKDYLSAISNEQSSATAGLVGLEREQCVDDIARRQIKRVTVVQEIWATPVGSSEDAGKRVALFLWKFNSANRGETGTTIWRNIIPPPSRILTGTPTHASDRMPLQSSTQAYDDQMSYPLAHNSLSMVPESWDTTQSALLEQIAEYDPISSSFSSAPSTSSAESFYQNMTYTTSALPQNSSSTPNNTSMYTYPSSYEEQDHYDIAPHAGPADQNHHFINATWENFNSSFADEGYNMQQYGVLNPSLGGS